ncbi:MAG: DUF3822 family protein [Flavobacterium sp.]|nr:MAG: DUF3822 family protein [Flavobacterium sp.]
MSNNAIITEKKYRKLTIKVSPEGLSFCCHDTLSGAVLSLREVDFSKYPRATRTEDHYWKAFVDNIELTRTYDSVSVIHDNNLNTFVPQPLFDVDYMGSYLQYNTKVFETDFFDYDELLNYDMNNVYIPYVNINNFLLDQFGTFEYHNANTILVSRLLDTARNQTDPHVYAHFSKGRFEIVVLQHQKLVLFNSFDFTTKEDFLYYLLFTAEQLSLNPEVFHLSLLGEVEKDSDLFRMAYKYVRNVSLYDVSALAEKNGLSAAENLKHFILLQS